MYVSKFLDEGQVQDYSGQIWHDQEMGNTFSVPNSAYYHFARGDIISLKKIVLNHQTLQILIRLSKLIKMNIRCNLF